jgi:non-specific serine/threonine protein kinase/serine/threonine-protein kinase
VPHSNEQDPPAPEPPDDLPLHLQQTQAGGPFDFSASGEIYPASLGDTVAIPGYADLVELHRGGQGIVYRALQISTRRIVAIKVLREGPQADSLARKRFQREAQLVAQLEHPHIVSVFDSGTTLRGELYFVMEFVRGVELDRHVRSKSFGVEDVVQLYRVVLDAVHHAHERGIVHRDLKPSNILIDELGQPRLVDFGLARPLQTGGDSFASITGQMLGTMAYMSPEQVRADPEIDARTDVYSLGVILYELLTGTSPYPSTSQVLDILRHITETPPRPPTRTWSLPGGVPQRSGAHRRSSGSCPIDTDLETIVLKAIAKSPAFRYASARQFADDLGRHAQGLPVLARRESGVYVLQKTLGTASPRHSLRRRGDSGVGSRVALRPAPGSTSRTTGAGSGGGR